MKIEKKKSEVKPQFAGANFLVQGQVQDHKACKQSQRPGYTVQLLLRRVSLKGERKKNKQSKQQVVFDSK